jgi:FkbM family methyltransferase
MPAIKRLIMGLLPSRLAGWLRAWRVRRDIGAYTARVVERAFGAGRLRVYLSDPLAEGWYDHDWPELPEVAALRQTTLRPGARVFDIGAHQGVVALMLAREVGATGSVVAVEPNPHNVAAAKRNRELNAMAGVEIVEAAIADRPGSLTFNEGLNGQLDDGSGAGGRRTVQAVTVDGLAERFGLPNVVFLDVEGAEGLALMAAARVLASSADFFVEMHVGCGLEKLGGSVNGVLAHFPESRYTLLVRAESDAAFRPLTANDSITRDRFFRRGDATIPGASA